MGGLLIKGFPEKLHDRLKQRATRNHRSLTKEALAILEAALSDRSNLPTLEYLDRHRIRGSRLLTDAMIQLAKRAGRA